MVMELHANATICRHNDQWGDYNPSFKEAEAKHSFSDTSLKKGAEIHSI